MTPTIRCLNCGAMIEHAYQVQDHANCEMPTLDQAMRAIVAPRGQQAGKQLVWCEPCDKYHLGARPHLGRHLRRAVGKLLREG